MPSASRYAVFLEGPAGDAAGLLPASASSHLQSQLPQQLRGLPVYWQSLQFCAPRVPEATSLRASARVRRGPMPLGDTHKRQAHAASAAFRLTAFSQAPYVPI